MCTCYTSLCYTSLCVAVTTPIYQSLILSLGKCMPTYADKRPPPICPWTLKLDSQYDARLMFRLFHHLASAIVVSSICGQCSVSTKATDKTKRWNRLEYVKETLVEATREVECLWMLGSKKVLGKNCSRR